MTPMTNKRGNRQQSSLPDWSDQVSAALEGKYLERLHRSQSGGDVLMYKSVLCISCTSTSQWDSVFIECVGNIDVSVGAERNTNNRICSSLIEANYLDSAPLHVHPVLAPTEKFLKTFIFFPPVFNIHRVFGQLSKKKQTNSTACRKHSSTLMCNWNFTPSL